MTEQERTNMANLLVDHSRALWEDGMRAAGDGATYAEIRKAALAIALEEIAKEERAIPDWPALDFKAWTDDGKA